MALGDAMVGRPIGHSRRLRTPPGSRCLLLEEGEALLDGLDRLPRWPLVVASRHLLVGGRCSGSAGITRAGGTGVPSSAYTRGARVTWPSPPPARTAEVTPIASVSRMTSTLRVSDAARMDGYRPVREMSRSSTAAGPPSLERQRRPSKPGPLYLPCLPANGRGTRRFTCDSIAGKGPTNGSRKPSMHPPGCQVDNRSSGTNLRAH